MKRLILLIVIASTMISVSCISNNYSKKSREELLIIHRELTIERSHELGRALVDYYLETGKVPPLFIWEDIDFYLENDETVKSYRRLFTDNRKRLEDFEMSISSWRVLMDSVKARNGAWDSELAAIRSEILDSLASSDGPYNGLLQSIEESLSVSNNMILAYIIDDYIKKGKEIPMNTVDEDVFGAIAVLPKVQKIDLRIRSVERALRDK